MSAVTLYIQVESLAWDPTPFWAQQGCLWMLMMESARVCQGVAPNEALALVRAQEAAQRYQVDYPGPPYVVEVLG